MAKSMAQVENGVVTNILWCSDGALETDALVNLADRPVGVGDTYDGEKFWRDGAEVLTPIEQAFVEIQNLTEQIVALDSAYQEGVNSL